MGPSALVAQKNPRCEFWGRFVWRKAGEGLEKGAPVWTMVFCVFQREMMALEGEEIAEATLGEF